MPGTDIVSVVPFEPGRGFSVQVPSGIHHVSHGLADFVSVHGSDAVEGEIGNCHSIY